MRISPAQIESPSSAIDCGKLASAARAFRDSLPNQTQSYTEPGRVIVAILCSAMKTRLLMLLVSGGFVAYSVCVLVPIANTDATKWPTVEGSIINRSVKHRARGKHLYTLRVTYEYRVAGVRYTCRRASLTSPVVATVNSATRPGAFEKFDALDKGGFRAGQKVRVYYDPKNPARAVLDPSLAQGWRAIFYGVAAFSALAFVAAIFGKLREPR